MDGNSGGTPSPFNNNTTDSEANNYDAGTDNFDAEGNSYNSEPDSNIDSDFNQDAEYGTAPNAIDYDDSISTMTDDYAESESEMAGPETGNPEMAEPKTTEIESEETFTETDVYSNPAKEAPVSSQMPDIPVKEFANSNKPATSSASRMPNIPTAGSTRIPHSHVRTMDSVIRSSAGTSTKASVPNNSVNFGRPMPVPVAGTFNHGAFDQNANSGMPGMNPSASQAPIPPVMPNDNLVASDSIVEPVKKKKTGLIIGIILLIIALGCGIAAAVMLLMPKADDRVEKAITRLINGQTPSNIMATGKITLTNGTPTSNGISALTINVDSKLATAQGAGESNFDIAATLADGREIGLLVDEVHTEPGDLYLKVSGLGSVVSAMTPLRPVNNYTESTALPDEVVPVDAVSCDYVMDETNCLPAEIDCDDTEDCDPMSIEYDPEAYAAISGIFDVIDDTWLRIPSETLTELSTEESVTLGGMTGLTIGDNSSQCLVSVMTNLGSYGSEVGKIYSQHPFVTYSTDSLKIAKKKDTLYRLGINETNFASFLNALPSSRLMNDILGCTGQSTAVQTISADNIKNIFVGTPVVYAEVDDSYNFTRLYFDASVMADTDNQINAEADFTISYPTAPITITEPGDYIDVQAALQLILTQMFGDIMTIEE